MDSTYKYPIGALANLFPDMDENIFAGLVRSIREDGLREPILVWRGDNGLKVPGTEVTTDGLDVQISHRRPGEPLPGYG